MSTLSGLPEPSLDGAPEEGSQRRCAVAHHHRTTLDVDVDADPGLGIWREPGFAAVYRFNTSALRASMGSSP